jgi:hypothetical protein
MKKNMKNNYCASLHLFASRNQKKKKEKEYFKCFDDAMENRIIGKISF